MIMLFIKIIELIILLGIAKLVHNYKEEWEKQTIIHDLLLL